MTAKPFLLAANSERGPARDGARRGAAAAGEDEVHAALRREVLQVVVVAAEVEVRPSAQQRQQAVAQRRLVAVRAVGVDGVMAVDDLPARLAAAQLAVQPFELRARHQVGVDREELHRAGDERVAVGGHAASSATAPSTAISAAGLSASTQSWLPSDG